MMMTSSVLPFAAHNGGGGELARHILVVVEEAGALRNASSADLMHYVDSRARGPAMETQK